MNQTRDIIVRLLSSMSSRKEVEQYLKEFSAVDSQKFALVKVGGAILLEQLEELVSALTFLQRVGLYPIVLHGAGPQLNRALADTDIPVHRIDGMRVTDPATLEVVRKVVQTENLRLVEALEQMGTRARPIPSGVFTASLRDPDRLGFVGDITEVQLEPIRSSIRSGTLPILTSLGETQDGQIVNINADVAARELALAIAPFKIIFLTSTGGLLDGDGEIIEAISLREDYDQLIQQPWLHSGMRVKIQEIKEMLDELPLESSVSMTRADQLARELFTHRGSGTLVRRGEAVLRLGGWNELDEERFGGLIEDCFGRPLVSDYLTSRDPLAVYLSEQYRATAVVVEQAGLPYLDKFATTPKAQGEGLGQSLWRRMRQDFPALFWRSRTSNPVNAWYFQQASGSYRTDTWTIFWYGLENFDDISRCVHHALDLPETLHPKEVENG